MPSVPDLLHPEAGLRLDARALREALTFAFATGGTGDTFSRILARPARAPSDFEAECFASDLFLNDFVARCLPVRVEGERYQIHREHFLGLLAHPPRDPQVSAFRQHVLAELLERPELRRALERLAAKIKLLVSKLEAPDRGKRYDAVGRRIDVLRAAKEAIDEMHGSFAGASSGLSRLGQASAELRQEQAYLDLGHLLDYEAHRATIDLRVRVGYDGELRSFQIVAGTLNSENPFYRTRFGRFVTKLKLWLRGYAFREAEVLGRLANGVFDGIQDAVITLFQVLCDAEFYLASLGLHDFARERGLRTCLPELVARAPGASAGPATALSLEALFNPFLLHEEHPPRPAQIQVSSPGLVVITGPNSGGKTRLLQALGLTQLLGQAGSIVPAARATLPVSGGLFVSLTHETHADQREGRLGTELLRIRRLFERLDCGSLVILDELCSGTNPSEGEEIFELVVGLLAELDPLAFITTHFLQFAARLASEHKLPRLGFLQVELDEHHRPTYGFIPGVASTSLASRTAERLGVTREALRELVERSKARAKTNRA